MEGGPAPDTVRTILVVDDEDRIRTLVAEMLKLAGYEAVVAAGAEQALELFERPGAIDLLLTDVKMPGMDGQALAARMRSLKPDLPVIYMTGYMDEETCPADVLAKPFRIGDLLHKVAEALGAPQPSGSK